MFKYFYIVVYVNPKFNVFLPLLHSSPLVKHKFVFYVLAVLKTQPHNLDGNFKLNSIIQQRRKLKISFLFKNSFSFVDSASLNMTSYLFGFPIHKCWLGFFPEPGHGNIRQNEACSVPGNTGRKSEKSGDNAHEVVYMVLILER